METELAKYACDECRNRKTRCSREAAGCVPCRADGRKCVYSRSGIIRRRARQAKRAVPPSSTISPHQSTTSESTGPTPPAGDLESQMTYDISTIHDSLRKYGDAANLPAGSLNFLGAEYSFFWQGPSIQDMARDLGMTEKKFLAFGEEESNVFAAMHDRVMENGRPIFIGGGTELSRIAFLYPERVVEKAHLLMVYGTVLTVVALDSSYDKKTVLKLRWNLRLSLDDANLLLEPTQLNVQALLMLAIHFQEICTPTLTWMAVSTASRMLQFLGVNARSVDQKTREHRIALFWSLNGIDKILAVVFGKPPSLPVSLSRTVPPVSMQQLLEFQPTSSVPIADTSKKLPSMFGAHYMDHFFRSSAVIADIWTCIFEDPSIIERVTAKLDEWYDKSISTLRACLIAERPFLDPLVVTSMQLGIDTAHFHHKYLHVLLARARPEKRNETVAAAQAALFSLDKLVADSTEFYNGIIWINLYCPFTPFFVLFGDVLSLRAHTSTQRSLEAMESMSLFLARMKPHHPQAAKLATVAATFVGYAKSVVRPDSSTTGLEVGLQGANLQTSEYTKGNRNSVLDGAPHSTAWEPTTQAPTSQEQQNQPQLLVDVFNDPSMQDLSMDLDYWFPASQRNDMFAPQGNGMNDMWNGRSMSDDAYGFFADSNFDWFAWDPDPALSYP